MKLILIFDLFETQKTGTNTLNSRGTQNELLVVADFCSEAVLLSGHVELIFVHKRGGSLV